MAESLIDDPMCPVDSDTEPPAVVALNAEVDTVHGDWPYAQQFQQRSAASGDDLLKRRSFLYALVSLYTPRRNQVLQPAINVAFQFVTLSGDAERRSGVFLA